MLAPTDGENEMTYTASVDRAAFPAFVSQAFNSKTKAIAWAKSQKGYNASVFKTVGWQNVWVGK